MKAFLWFYGVVSGLYFNKWLAGNEVLDKYADGPGGLAVLIGVVVLMVLIFRLFKPIADRLGEWVQTWSHKD